MQCYVERVKEILADLIYHRYHLCPLVRDVIVYYSVDFPECTHLG